MSLLKKKYNNKISCFETGHKNNVQVFDFIFKLVFLPAEYFEQCQHYY